MKNRILLCALVTVLGAAQAPAQKHDDKLALALPRLFGPRGLSLPSGFHAAHFETGRIQESFTSLNTAVASQIARLPLASPASGFLYTFNPAIGVYERSTRSLGPILTERAETIGRRSFFISFSHQYFKFDSIDGIDLERVPAILRHERETGRLYEEDFIATNNSISLNINQFTAYATFGVTDRLDLSLAVPIVTARLGLVSDARIQRVAPPDPVFGQSHFFDSADPENSVRRIFADNRSATGIGDVTVRAKWTAFRGEQSAVAFAADVRAPTGDEYNFLGAGAVGLRPFLVYSFHRGRVAPHFNLGYQWNGRSVLASNDIASEAKWNLPDALTYAAGADMALARRFTLALDFLGERVFNGQRLARVNFTAPVIGGTFTEAQLVRNSFNLLSGAVGGKLNLTNTLLLSGNVVFRLNDAGLKAPVVPLVGLSYTF